jgi:uncharacterized membrane protein
VKRAPALAVLWFLLCLGYVAASALGERPLALASVGLMAGAALMVSGRVLVGVVVGLALAAAAWHWGEGVAALAYLPPLAAFAFMAWFFGRTLAPGHVPFIVRIARMEHPELPASMERHARGLTMLWTALFIALFMATVALALVLPFTQWARWTQALGYLVPAVLFIGELAYRKVVFARYSHGGLVDLVRLVVIATREEARVGRPAAGERA